MNKFIFILLFLLPVGMFLSCGRRTEASWRTGADSLYTPQYIVKIQMKQPQRAFALIDTAEQLKRLSSEQANDMRAMIYQVVLNNPQRALAYCLQNYRSDSVRAVPSRMLTVLRRISNLNLTLGEYEDCIRYSTEGIELADEKRRIDFKTDFLFNIGTCMKELNRRQEALNYMKRGIREFEQANDPKLNPMLSFYYGTLMNFYQEEDRYAEAIAVGQKRKKLIDAMCAGAIPSYAPIGYTDQQYGYVYSKLATLYALSGNRKEADACFKSYQHTDFSRSAEGNAEILLYYQSTQQYRKVIDYYQTHNLQGDTVSQAHIEALSLQAAAYEGLHNTGAALRLEKRIGVLKDSLWNRLQHQEALKWEIAYHTRETEMQLSVSEAASKRNAIAAGSLAAIVLLLLILAYLQHRYSRIVLQKNRILAKQIDELMDYQQSLERMKDQLLLLQHGSNRTLVDNPSKEMLSNREIFDRMCGLMEQRRLYLQPDLSRDTLVDLMGVDKTKLTQIIQENTEGGNLTTFVTGFRLKHALHLLKMSPHYTIQAVATDSGFSSIRSLQRAFKERLGMTPAEYRNVACNMK